MSQFDNEISKDLRPRLEKTGDEGLLQPFLDFFKNKSFQVGTTLLSLWEGKNIPKASSFLISEKALVSEGNCAVSSSL